MYFNVLNLPSVENEVKRRINVKFDELWRGLVTTLVKHQAMNDLILRIALLLKREDEKGFLFFDAEAQIIKDSLYALLASVFKKEGVAVGRGEYLEVERIVHYHLLDSRLVPALWIADLFAYGVHMVLENKQTEIHEKIARVLDKGPRGKNMGVRNQGDPME